MPNREIDHTLEVGLSNDGSLGACTAPEPPTPEGIRRFRLPGDTQDALREVFSPISSMSWSVEGVPELAGMSETIAAVLDFNAVRFPGARSDFYAFLPGALYKEVYLRDMLTTTKVSQYLYGDAFLRGVLEHALTKQITEVAPDAAKQKVPFPGPGALHGLFTSDGRSEKTTAVSDEETSAIQLAHLYYRSVGGPDWLQCSIGGLTILQRLNTAMERLFQSRQDPSSGLIKRAHTTDWGDVRFQGGVSPTRADPTFEYWTASIYDQAWTYLAVKQLAEMNRATGQHLTAERWQQAGERLRANAHRFLWQPDRGFFRLHLHLTPLVHDFDEDRTIAIGNAMAVYAGMAYPDYVPQILQALEYARLQAGATKPGVSLFPPYHEGFFRHPLLYESGSYQNGGLWDWWGAIQITAEFEAGQSDLARQHLQAVAKDWARHPKEVAEWQTPSTNRPQGSGQYAGAAGTMGEAIIRGLFGVHLSRDGFALHSRLGQHKGHLQITQPASGYALWMRQRTAESVLLIQYSTNHPKPGTFSALLPKESDVESIMLDGLPQPVTMRRIAQDFYAGIDSVPTGTHTIEIRFAPRKPLPLSAAWLGHDFPAIFPPQQRVTGVLRVENRGIAPWLKEGLQPIRLSYRWLDAQAQALPGETIPEPRASLPHTVGPGQSVSIPLSVQSPQKPGAYRLRFDLLQEHVTWFAQAASQNQPLELSVRVTDQPLAVQWLNGEDRVTVGAGQETTFGLAFGNVGLAKWHQTGVSPVRVALRWIRSNGEAYQAEPGLGVGIALPSDVSPGEVARIEPLLRVPRVPGTYRARFELIQELQLGGSVSASGDRPRETEVTVTP